MKPRAFRLLYEHQAIHGTENGQQQKVSGVKTATGSQLHVNVGTPRQINASTHIISTNYLYIKGF